MTLTTPDRETVVTLGGVVLASTVLLTACFVGILSLVTNGFVDFADRLPVYSMVTGVVFVSAIIGFARTGTDARIVISGAIGGSMLAFVLVSLAIEGAVYTTRAPDAVVSSQLIFYFVAAGLIATGCVYWVATYWREIFDTAEPVA